MASALPSEIPEAGICEANEMLELLSISSCRTSKLCQSLPNIQSQTSHIQDFRCIPTLGRVGKRGQGQAPLFGKWDDWEAALEKFEKSIHDIRRGCEPSLGPINLSVVFWFNGKWKSRCSEVATN